MLSAVTSCALNGIDGYKVTVEVNISGGLPFFEVVGLPDTAVKESRERVRAALKNSGFGFPDDRITVNLAPADIKKEGPIFDLPIAVGIVVSQGRIAPGSLRDTAFLGELSLEGSIRRVRGVLPMAISLRSMGMKRLIFPAENTNELSCIDGIELLPASHLSEVTAHLKNGNALKAVAPRSYDQLLTERRFSVDFAFVKGQKAAKRALEIAASGGHNVLMVGEPGSGKTLMARALPGILPDMTFDEALEVTRIHSAANLPVGDGLLVERPFRAPHHTASSIALTGGGSQALPGEISRAHQGVLFLDELPEFRRDVLEALRQPMEDGFVTVTRVGAQATYPSQFMLVCSMNPCPCGHYGSRSHVCRCTPTQINRYLNRISGPLLDRIDIHIEVQSIPPETLRDMASEEDSDTIRKRVEKARRIQRERYAKDDITCNARLDARTIDRYCPMDDSARDLLKQAAEKLNLSNRAFTRMIKVSRTIADLAEEDIITARHIAEAVQYRSLDRKYWG